jgi:hypothetical protein
LGRVFGRMRGVIMFKKTIIFSVIITLQGCLKQSSNSADDSNKQTIFQDDVTDKNISSEPTEFTEFKGQISSGYYDRDSDSLVLNLSFLGCDVEHTFDLKMEVFCKESFPAQCDAKLLHIKGSENTCDKSIDKQLNIKLENLHPYDTYYLYITESPILIDINGDIEKLECDTAYEAWKKKSDEILSLTCETDDDCIKFEYGSLNLDLCYSYNAVSKIGLSDDAFDIAKELHIETIEKCVVTGVIENEGGVCLTDIMPISGMGCVKNECTLFYGE